ncbi:pectate lyase [uncultured Bacteroides sp.]|uniref:pectate lyase n=1 Tax=uncultured Bacteroides sp. TaxID=162156 RepID=UPI002AA87CF2|nr:pectate lyase [uncultured Bacteroides sp.]
MKKITLIIALFTLCITGIYAQGETNYKAKQPYKNWVKLVPKLKDDFYHSKEAVRIADNVLLYQQTTGGWPKNIFMPAELTEAEKQAVIASQNDVNESTIDNSATSTEIEYLARTYQTTKNAHYKEAVLKGIGYLLKAQYANGGWPQFYPRPKGYYIEITYNDNAMFNVMELLREVYEGKAPYTFIPNETKEKAHTAFNKGIDCILKTQVRHNGKLTVWCAQHDHITLKPAKARAYELPSLSGQESDNLTLLLMSLPNPSKEIKEAIEGAVAWFKESEIKNTTKEYFTNKEGRKDYRMTSCTNCPPIWARFYDLDTNRPFFCDRDGIKVSSISDIGYERRNGYGWYNSDGIKLFQEYAKWKKEH